jgi:hypothetical protein
MTAALPQQRRAERIAAAHAAKLYERWPQLRNRDFGRLIVANDDAFQSLLVDLIRHDVSTAMRVPGQCTPSPADKEIVLDAIEELERDIAMHSAGSRRRQPRGMQTAAAARTV